MYLIFKYQKYLLQKKKQIIPKYNILPQHKYCSDVLKSKNQGITCQNDLLDLHTFIQIYTNLYKFIQIYTNIV